MTTGLFSFRSGPFLVPWDCIGDGRLSGHSSELKDWAQLEGHEEWESALAISGYIEATGDMYLHLLAGFGGYFEHLQYKWWEIVPQLAQMFLPIHQRYRWFPPLGSYLFDARSIAEGIVGHLINNGPGGVACLNLIKSLGFDVLGHGGGGETLALVLPGGEKNLLIIGLPTESARRYERIAWLHAVVKPPFEDVPEGWRPATMTAWQVAWSRLQFGTANDILD